MTEAMLTDYNVGDWETQDKDAVNGQRDEEQIEVAVVTTSNTVADPWTVVIKPLWTKHIDNIVIHAVF